MEKDKEVTEVMFRKMPEKDWKGDILALMPYDFESNTDPNKVNSYQHVGQHGTADYLGMIAISRPATPVEYEELKAELENNYGYNFNVIKRRNYSRALAEWRKETGKK